MADTMTRTPRRAPNADSLKVPPHSLEAEQAVLGGLMLDNEAWDQIAGVVNEDDFYIADHRAVFAAIRELADKSQPFDIITLSDWLDQRKTLSDRSVLGYVGALARDTPSAANIRAYAEIVRERSILRRLISVGTQICEAAFNADGRDTKALLDEAEQRVFQIAEQGIGSGFRNIKSLLLATSERIDALFEKDDPITGLASGFKDFDEKTAGLQPGDLIIIAGRPSMGKTSFAMNIAEYAAVKHRSVVAIFSLEMPGEQIAMRMLASLGRIDQQRLRTGKLLDEDWPRLSSAMAMLSDTALYVDDGAALTPTEVRARARRLKRERGLDLIIVDYLQLMRVTHTGENRATEISEISRGLKALAKELGVPIVALSQLNRSLEQRPNKRPVMSDLRESGAIEQDADLIAFIYRDEVYNEDSPDKGTAEIIIAKQRNGPIGMTRLTFLGQYTKFENYTPEIYSSERFA